MRGLRPSVARLGGTTCLLLVAACSAEPPEPVKLVVVSPPSATLASGATQALTAALTGTKGGTLSGRTVTWSSSNPAVAAVSATGTVTAGRVLGGANETVTITATSETVTGAASIAVQPVPVGTVAVTGSAALRPGGSLQLAATTTSATAEPLTGRAVTWASSDIAVATVSAGGVVTATSYTGPATRPVSIIASAEGQSGTVALSVTPLPVATVLLAPASAALRVGETATLAATLRDAGGTTLSARTVTWGTANPAVATVSAAGVVTAVAAGSTTISATSEGQTASAPVVVTSTAAPVIAGLAPPTSPTIPLAFGTTLTITGSGFASTPAGNRVTVGGVAATVLTASATQLTVRMPCAPGGSNAVAVTVDGAVSNTLPVIVGVPQYGLAVGQVLLRESADLSACNELVLPSGSARYLVMLYSTATSQNTLVDLQLNGNPAPAGALRAPAVVAPPAPPAALRIDPAQAARDRAHFQHLERERALYAQLMASGAAAAPRPRAALRSLPELGEMRTFYYNFTGCNDSTQVIRAKAIRVGTRAIIWEDSANALQAAATPVLAGYYDRLGRVFDRDQYDAVRTYFGDPLRRDAVTDNDGRLNMLFTQRLNGSGAAAYVTSCDQFVRASGRWGSNFGENFYATVPTTATLNINSTASPDGWYYFMGRTVVHEVKHIASQAARVANGAPTYEQSWLEEGTARHAEEVWVRDSLHRIPWKANTGWGTAASNGLVCDFSPTDATCLAADTLRRPSYGMRRQFNEILPKLSQPWNWSPYGDGTGQSGAVFYNSTWSLVRYASDRHAGTDAQFLTALTQSSLAGTANLAAVAGVSIDRLIALWGLALFTDDLPGLPAGSADLSFATWNLRSIYAGLNATPAWQSRFPTPFPIAPVALTAGSFATTRTGVRGGAHAYYLLSSAAAGTQLLSLSGVDGATIPATARIAVVRLP
jgi:uncharacterized protein YjdB